MFDSLHRQGEAALRRQASRGGARKSQGLGRPEGELGFIFQGLGGFVDLAQSWRLTLPTEER